MFLRDDRKCNIKELPPPKMPFPLAVYFSELHCHAIYICKLSVRSCLCNASRCQMICWSHPEGGTWEPTPRGGEEGGKGGKSKLGGKSYGGAVINVAAVLRRRMGGCLTSRVTPDPTHVPGSIW